MRKQKGNSKTTDLRSLKVWLGPVALVLALVGVFLYASYGKKDDAASQSELSQRSRRAPEFSLQDSKGNEHRLEDLKGNAVLIHFWASWCPPCLEEIPNWVELAQDFRSKPLKLVAINLDPSWDEAHRVLPSRGLPPNLISVIDLGQKVADEFGSYSFPETYLLNSDLEIVTKWVGPQDWRSPQVRSVIERALAGVSASSTRPARR